MSEFAGEELGCLLGIDTHAAWWLMSDAVNLRHRHPRLWAKLAEGEVVDWLASKTARLVAAAGLDLAQALWVDEQTAPYVTSLPKGRYLNLVEAKIIEADPANAAKRAEARALERFVRTGQADEHGLKTMVARATAGDIIFFVAMTDRIAQILGLQGDTDPIDVRRSKALGILATPARALELLAWAEGGARSEVPPEKLLPKATLFVHVSAETVRSGEGVVRVEDDGPVTVGEMVNLLQHCHVTVRPVLDLAGGMPVDCWEVPDRMQAVANLREPFETFPWGTQPARRADKDHIVPYVPPDAGGPPGQTHPDNLTPLGRKHHRVKTHGRGWRHRQLMPGTTLWCTPSGYWYRVDRDGTHALGRSISLLEEHLGALLRAA